MRHNVTMEVHPGETYPRAALRVGFVLDRNSSGLQMPFETMTVMYCRTNLCGFWGLTSSHHKFVVVVVVEREGKHAYMARITPRMTTAPLRTFIQRMHPKPRYIPSGPVRKSAKQLKHRHLDWTAGTPNRTNLASTNLVILLSCSPCTSSIGMSMAMATFFNFGHVIVKFDVEMMTTWMGRGEG